MVIQRWQSLFLLLASVFMGIFLFTPIISIGTTGFVAIDYLPLIIIGALTILLSLLTIFLYKNLRKQIKTTYICILLSLATIASTFIMAYTTESASEKTIAFGGCFAILAIISQLMAVRGMKGDEKKLRSYDRIR